jgi:hypothetical protein
MYLWMPQVCLQSTYDSYEQSWLQFSYINIVISFGIVF